MSLPRSICLVPQLNALFGLRNRTAAPEEERQHERNARQGIDQEGKMPVDFSQVTRYGSRYDERQVVDRRAVTQLPDAVVAREIIDDQARREGNDHTGPDTQDATDNDQPRHAPGKDAGHAAQEKDRKPGDQDFEFVLTHRQFSGEQHEGNDQQRRQRRKHLDFEVRDLGEHLVQVAQNRGDGQSRQRRNGRHRPDSQQHDERNGAFSCFDFHCRGFY